MPRFRIVTYPSGKPWTPWRHTRDETIEDAIAAELAERDEDDPAKLYWDPLALIEIEEEDGDVRTENPNPRPPVVSPLPEWELWACAETVMRQHGERALIHVADRVGALGRAGDAEGVATWKAIAQRIQSLSDEAPQMH